MKINQEKEQYFLSVLADAARTGFQNQGQVSELGLNDFSAQFEELRKLLGSPVAASKLMAYLIELATPRPRSLIWLRNEMWFEVLVARTGERNEIAAKALHAWKPDDAALDLYNDRLKRVLTEDENGWRVVTA